MNIIAAMTEDRAIGKDGRLPWHVPEDLARFKRLTMGHAIIMGRRTFQSLPGGALPGRRNIVLSHNGGALGADDTGCMIYGSLQAALAGCADAEPFVIGGASVYARALPLASTLYLTIIDGVTPGADTFFPPIDRKQWLETENERHEGFSFLTLVRRG